MSEGNGWYWLLTAILIPGSVVVWNRFLSPLLQRWGEARIKAQEAQALASIEGEADAREYTQQMSIARFEAHQTDRALERSTQLGQMERLTDLLQDELIFHKELIRSLLKMPDLKNEEMVSKITAILDNRIAGIFEERDRKRASNNEQ